MTRHGLGRGRKRTWRTLTAFIGALTMTSFAGAASPTPEAPSGLRLTISQVVPLAWPRYDVYFSVRDAQGRPVGLSQLDRRKLCVLPGRDTDPQPASSVSSLLLVDKSDSMNQPADNGRSKLEAVKTGLKQFADTMRANDRCAILEFGSTVPGRNEVTFLPKGPGLAERAAAIRPNRDVTRLYDAISSARAYLRAQNLATRTPVVVLTDGFNNIHTVDGEIKGELEGEEGLNRVLSEIQQSGIRVDVIGFGRKDQPQPGSRGAPNYWQKAANYLDVPALMKIAEAGPGGQCLISPSARNLAEYYVRLNRDYQSELVIHCNGEADLGQDRDPGVQVVYERADGAIESNKVFIGFIVPPTPPMGHEAYRDYAVRRTEYFTVFLAALAFLWWLPRMGLGKILGETVTTTSSQSAPRGGRGGAGPTPGGWGGAYQPNPQDYWAQQRQAITQRITGQGPYPPPIDPRATQTQRVSPVLTPPVGPPPPADTVRLTGAAPPPAPGPVPPGAYETQRIVTQTPPPPASPPGGAVPPAALAWGPIPGQPLQPMPSQPSAVTPPPVWGTPAPPPAGPPSSSPAPPIPVWGTPSPAPVPPPSVPPIPYAGPPAGVAPPAAPPPANPWGAAPSVPQTPDAPFEIVPGEGVQPSEGEPDGWGDPPDAPGSRRPPAEPIGLSPYTQQDENRNQKR